MSTEFNYSDLKPELVEEFVPVIFEEPNESIIPRSIVNQNYFKENDAGRWKKVIEKVVSGKGRRKKLTGSRAGHYTTRIFPVLRAQYGRYMDRPKSGFKTG
ncbi:hypothetical protein NPIL_684721 [Nephila pilipes]|uniref:Uncharacterized protein n=1 Tax=Nephila pilipes TaxID=299642 RepID=A0A8X6NWA6_NEPPI|nr:hypothetical protein NPIL_684721 [Nephila pilipes]